MEQHSRKSFFTRMAGAGAGMALTNVLPAVTRAAAPAGLPRRKFGRHDVQVSALGVGGHHLGSAGTKDEAVAIVHEAIANGVNFFDNAWEYNNHRSEEYLGAGLRGGYRDRAFLMTKVCTHGRDASVAMQMLEQSLKRLGTDHLDLWQIHAVVYDNDPDLAYRKNGVIEALDKAKQQGKVRFVGFTGHKDPQIHLRMLTMGYRWDAVQMPLNAFDAQFRSFAQIVLPEARKQNIAILGMKPFNGRGDPFHHGDVNITPEAALRYAMSVDGVTTTITGMESLAVLRQNLAIVNAFTPMTAAEMTALEGQVAEFAGDGRFETYKTSLAFDDIVTRQMHEMPLNGANA